ncbi:uncharacterized protein LOC126484658 [Schistocerca serialis cubense]|uniref:uncharacterized protein LOC126484658 n=1 Tax=Schistocerca serialis cubense TaxID=2023355 RepID=UPI00214E3970|nr:uncharacterized protein LOC126484658 [Schistocerca serialis cubense]
MGPVVNGVNLSTYYLEKCLAHKLHSLVGHTRYLLRILCISTSSQQVIATDLTVSFDVKSLFTSVPLAETINILQEQILPDICDLVWLCSSSTYFSWQGKFYEQIDGMVMASPLSHVVADIFLRAFKQIVLNSMPLHPHYWLQYEDSTFVIWSTGEIELHRFYEQLNILHRTYSSNKKWKAMKLFLFLMQNEQNFTENSSSAILIYQRKIIAAVFNPTSSLH